MPKNSAVWENISEKFHLKIDELFMHRAIWHRGKIYFFYGEKTDTIYVLDLHTMDVKSFPQNSLTRTFYSLNVHDDTVLVFGGHQLTNFYNNDLVSYNSDDLTVNRHINNINQSLCPTARRYHASTILGSYFYLFGGEVSWDEQVNDLWRMDLRSMEWEEIVCEGDIPPPRRYHTMVSYGHCLYLFGGRDQFIRMNDLWEFNTIFNTWKLCKQTGDVPFCRAGHTSVVYKRFMYLFGGNYGEERDLQGDLYELDLDSKDWKRYEIPNKPKGRFWHCAAIDPENGIMYIQGGRSDHVDTSFHDIWRVALPNASDHFISLNGNHNFVDVEVKCLY